MSKLRIWMFQIPVILVFTISFWITEAGVQGDLESPFWREKIFPTLRTVSGWFTNLKFKSRGAQPPKNKVVIVEIDNRSIETIGRWPWHRNAIAELIHYTFEAGAKVVGLDIVFSEADQRVPPELQEVLKKHRLESYINQLETDLFLRETIKQYQNRLVLGWAVTHFCQPKYMDTLDCPAGDKKRLMEYFPQGGFEKFSIQKVDAPSGFDPQKTPLVTAIQILPNLDIYTEAAQYAGFFQAFPDQDGYIRRTNLTFTTQSKFYPALALEMARVGLNESIALTLDRNSRISKLKFLKSAREIPLSPLGAMEINFRGPSYTFQYISALDVIQDQDAIQIQTADRKLASVSKSELLKDAYVLIGVSALGVFDMRAFPFDSNTPGVEGHANILDNLLSHDMLRRGLGKDTIALLFLLMTLGAVLFAYFTERLESIPALLLFVAVTAGLSFTDFEILFEKYQMDLNTGFLYLELLTIFGTTLAARYVLEERSKKFIKTAFSKYVAPAIVDSILKDPTKLTVGGVKKDLTILFSDIRSFTTFSEQMDAKQLASFLNDYLGLMTNIVFDCEGTLDKYIGDAVMAFWGAPLDQPKHAANACKAAIQMQKVIREHHARFKTQYGVDVSVGIGINSGPVSVGNMGSDRIFEYTVIGDHVNLASRLEGLTKTYGVSIVTSRFTFDLMAQSGESLPPHRILDQVKVKGKKNTVELIQILDRELPSEGIKYFSEAKNHYLKREWDDAIRKFELANEFLRVSPEINDQPCQIFIERCQKFKEAPPNADWDGSWEMSTK